MNIYGYIAIFLSVTIWPTKITKVHKVLVLLQEAVCDKLVTKCFTNDI